MPNTRHTKTKKESGLKAVILEGSTSLINSVNMDGVARVNSLPPTTATILTASQKTDKSAELKAKLDLVAGALADFQAAGGRVISKNVDATLPSGSIVQGVKIYLVADVGITKSQTADGLEFDLVAEKGK